MSEDHEYIKATIKFNEDPATVFDALQDFESFQEYSDGVRIAGRGDGSEGTRYYIQFKQRILDIPARYEARARVTGFDEPNRVDWEVTKDLDMWGSWAVDAADDGGSVATLEVNMNLDNSDLGALPAPGGATANDILDALWPMLFDEGEGLLEELTEDIEGTRRTPDIVIEDASQLFEGRF